MELVKIKVTGDEAYIPWSSVFTAGFSCKSRSSASSKAASHVNCLQNQDTSAETSFTFESIYSYISKVLPLVVLLENVVGLLQKISASATTDAEWVVTRLMSLGYYCKWFTFDAEFYGSPASRMRIYFVAWLICPGRPLEKTSVLFEKLAGEFQWLDSFLEAFCIGPLPTEKFVTKDHVQYGRYLDMAEHTSSPGSASKKDMKWEDEHCTVFRAHGITWPVDFPAMVNEEGLIFIHGNLSVRQVELLYFLNRVFPMSYDTKHIEYVDVNPSLGRAVGSEESYPWRTTSTTLVGSSIMCVRYWDDKCNLVVRPLTGIETFSLIGWDPSYYRRKKVGASHETLGSLAGNAFSAFAVLPMYMVVFSGLGILKEMQHQLTELGQLPSPNSPETLLSSDSDIDGGDIVGPL